MEYVDPLLLSYQSWDDEEPFVTEQQLSESEESLIPMYDLGQGWMSTDLEFQVDSSYPSPYPTPYPAPYPEEDEETLDHWFPPPQQASAPPMARTPESSPRGREEAADSPAESPERPPRPHGRKGKKSKPLAPCEDTDAPQGGLDAASFEVQKIVDSAETGGRVRYLVRWKGWPRKKDWTWEPYDHFDGDGAKAEVLRFHRRNPRKPADHRVPLVP